MWKLALLTAIALGIGYFYPMRHEGVATACEALDRRIAATLALPAASTAAGRAVHQAAAGAIHGAWPFLPAEPGCVLAYWLSLLHPAGALPGRR